MRSLYHHHHLPLSRSRLFRLRKRSSLSSATASFYSSSNPPRLLKLNGSNFREPDCRLQQRSVRVRSFDESFDISPLNDWSDNNGDAGYMLSSSDGEDSDEDIILNPVSDLDLPSAAASNNDAITITTHRLGMIGRGHKKHRIKLGILINCGLIAFLMAILSFVDCWGWKIVRLPLSSFYLSRPFFISAALVCLAGYLCIPFLDYLKIHQIISKKRPTRHSKKKETPTMGGLIFVPIGLGVAKVIACSSHEVTGVAISTLAFLAIGLLDDILNFRKNQGDGLSGWIKLLLELAVGTWFSFWLDTTSISSPYSMKMVIPLPAPLGLVCLGKYYMLLTTLSFVSMGHGVNLTDGLDGLAGGAAALAFIGMSIAVLPICSELSLFGASMAGACVGFLWHNHYKASIFMGDTGSLALGAALAAMAACTGMFFPLFVSSGIFVLEASSVIIQVLYYNATKQLCGVGHRLLQMTPFHHHLELLGFKEPYIVAVAYALSCILAVYAGYLGLISA